MLTEFLVNSITTFISAVSYIGIFILMLLESTLIPLPSELVMPFAGFLVALGKMNLWLVIIFSTLGSLAGSLIGYWIGRKYSKSFIKKFGKYLLIEVEHLKKAEKWFKKYGNKTIFFSRFIPGVRHVISVPAGTAKMSLKKFSILTLIGAGIWNSFLLWLGYVLEKNWQIVYSYTKIIDMLVIAIIFLLIIYYAYKIMQKNSLRAKAKRVLNTKRK